ncbi:MAG: DUF1015 family protein [Actinomycetota bacterium]
MPELRPFHGIRYASSAEMKDLICPPYDVISADEQARLHDRHPHNAVRLELARSGAGAEKYRDVASTFEAWLDEAVLSADEEECLYVYRQDFVSPTGKRCRVAGVIGALRLEPFGGSSGILPHERTMPGPIEDRLALMRACPVNISPIYSIYRGNGGLVSFYESLESRPPEIEFADDDGTRQRLWVIRAGAEIEMLTDAVRAGPLVVADGHHRYETALAYHKENRDAPGGHDAMMCFCVDADAENLVVLPYNRALRTAIPAGDLRRRVEERFAARTPAGDGTAELDGSKADHPFLFLFADGPLLAEVSADEVAPALGDRADAWKRLDVVALHESMLLGLLPEGIDELKFATDRSEIVDLVASHGWTAGILLRALDPVQVVEVARSGERMPQKASYFWPKAATGMVFRSLR